jgi:Fe-S cluster biosynthesis and repair protein YggX
MKLHTLVEKKKHFLEPLIKAFLSFPLPETKILFDDITQEQWNSFVYRSETLLINKVVI